MHRPALVLASLLPACFSEAPRVEAYDTAPSEESSTSGSGNETANDDMPALDACIEILGVWWDEHVCAPPENDAPWCMDESGGSAFEAADRIDTCNALVDAYAITPINRALFDACIEDMRSFACWSWHVDSDDCTHTTCSSACDSIGIIGACYKSGTASCAPAFSEGC